MSQEPKTELMNDERARQDPASAADAPVTKIASVIGLLRNPPGAALADLTAATGWLPHTTRAALTGLRKKGHVITKAKVEPSGRHAGGALSTAVGIWRGETAV